MHDVMTFDEIMASMKNKVVPVASKFEVMAPENFVPKRKSSTAGKKQCPHCKVYHRPAGFASHVRTCAFNPKTTNPMKKCAKCSFDIDVRSHATHEKHCTGDMFIVVHKVINRARGHYHKVKKIKARGQKISYPVNFVSDLNKKLHDRGMSYEWAVNTNCQVVRSNHPATLPLRDEEDIVKPVENNLKVTSVTPAKTNNNIVDALTELLVEEMGALNLVNKIDSFLKWQSLTQELLG